VWKSTYRIILPQKAGEKPLFQGWAIVDNTIGEDWKDVQLSLIAGAPQSFIQDISQPLYARRPVVALPQSAILTPQTHEATLKEEESASAMASLSPGVVGGVPGGVPGGQMGGVMGSIMGGPSNTPAKPIHGYDKKWLEQDVRSLERLRQYEKLNEPAAESKDLGDYFEYNLKQSITIGKNQSALVPILQ